MVSGCDCFPKLNGPSLLVDNFSNAVKPVDRFCAGWVGVICLPKSNGPGLGAEDESNAACVPKPNVVGVGADCFPKSNETAGGLGAKSNEAGLDAKGEADALAGDANGLLAAIGNEDNDTVGGAGGLPPLLVLERSLASLAKARKLRLLEVPNVMLLRLLLFVPPPKDQKLPIVLLFVVVAAML